LFFVANLEEVAEIINIFNIFQVKFDQVVNQSKYKLSFNIGWTRKW